MVNARVLIELKSITDLHLVRQKQLHTYWKLTGSLRGLLINFDGALLKGKIERRVVGEAPDLRAEPISPE